MKVKSKSKFTGGLLGLIGISILASLLTACTLCIGAPWAFCMTQRWIVNHTIVDGKQLYFDGTGGQLWGKIFLWLLLTVVTLGLFVLWYPIVMQKWVTKHTHFLEDEPEKNEANDAE